MVMNYGVRPGSALSGDIFGGSGGFGGATANLREAADKICSSLGEASKPCQTARQAAENASKIEGVENIPIAQYAPYAVAAITVAWEYLKGGSCTGYIPPDDRGELPVAVACEMYRYDYDIVNRPEDDRCDWEAYDNSRIDHWNELVDQWYALTASQRSLATTTAQAEVAVALANGTSIPLEPNEAWRNWVPAELGLSAADKLKAQKAAAALTAANNAAKIGTVSQTAVDRAVASALAKDAAKSAATIGTVSQTAVDRAVSSTLSKDAISLAVATEKSKKKTTAVVVGTLLVASAIGGVVYWQYKKKHPKGRS